MQIRLGALRRRIPALSLLLCSLTLAAFIFAPGPFINTMFRWRLPRLVLELATSRTNHCSFFQILSAKYEPDRMAEAWHRVREVGGRPIRVDSGLEYWQTRHGRFWILPNNAHWLNFMLIEGEDGIYSSRHARVRPGDVVLDVGASVGNVTRESLANGARLVVAIEPYPPQVECLRRNFAQEITAGRVIVYPKGVWHEDDWLDLAVEDATSSSSLVMERKGSKVRVPLTTIDKVVAELKLRRVDFINMDIEGSERHALQGAKSTITQFHPRMAICAYHMPDDPIVIPGVIKAIDGSYREDPACCKEAEGFAVRQEVKHFY